MDTNEGKLLLKNEVFQIVGSAIEVLNTLGTWARREALRKCVGRGVWSAKNPVSAAALFDILYKGHRIGLFIPDLVKSPTTNGD